MSVKLPDYRAILDFWFGEITAGWRAENGGQPWFQSAPAQDREIARRFGAAVQLLGAGRYRDWMDEPEPCLAAIIALDQFPRNIFRGDAAAFAHDDKSLALTRHALEREFDPALAPVQRVFLYLPLEHSESLAMQDLSVEKFERLAAAAPPAYQKDARNYLEYARAHRKVIARFGRFPHRNELLGRPSTPEEQDWLAGGGETFGQSAG